MDVNGIRVKTGPDLVFSGTDIFKCQERPETGVGAQDENKGREVRL